MIEDNYLDMLDKGKTMGRSTTDIIKSNNSCQLKEITSGG
jgi:hypothetical protein